MTFSRFSALRVIPDLWHSYLCTKVREGNNNRKRPHLLVSQYSAANNGNSVFHLGGPRHDAKRQVWRDSVCSGEAREAGKTVYPLIDAIMRELKVSGFMPNTYVLDGWHGIFAQQTLVDTAVLVSMGIMSIFPA